MDNYSIYYFHEYFGIIQFYPKVFLNPSSRQDMGHNRGIKDTHHFFSYFTQLNTGNINVSRKDSFILVIKSYEKKLHSCKTSLV